MKQLMLRHAFRFMKIVIVFVGPQNLRPQKALEKTGAVRVGSEPDGRGHESVLYRITVPGS
jgi:hypothetical protein